MTTELQLKGYSTATLATTVGAERELIINTDTWQPTFHDGVTPGGNSISERTQIVQVTEADFTAGVYTASAPGNNRLYIVDLSASGDDRTFKVQDATAGTAALVQAINYNAGSVKLTVTTVGGTQLIGDATSQLFEKSSETMTLTDDTTRFVVTQDSRINKSSVDVIAWNDGVTEAIDLEDEARHYLSSNKLSGSTITKDTTTVDVAQGEWYLRNADNDDATLRPAVVAAATGISIPDNDTTYITADYNGGTPIHSSETDISNIPCQSKCVAAVVSRVNSNIDVLELGEYANDFYAKYARAEAVTGWLKYGDGLQISETGTRNIAITAGSLYIGVARFTTPALDTSAAGTFTYYYQDGVGGWAEQASSTQINHTQYDDGSGTLATGSANKYYVHAVYARINSPTEFAVIYPQVVYNSLAEAQANAGSPQTVPAFGEAFSTGRFIGSIITKYNTVAFEDILSPFSETLVSATPTEHNNLSGLQLSTTGVTYGHIDDQAQTIYGAKTFNSNVAATLSTAAQPNITSVGKLTGFESTGIDDNASSTAVTIDSSQNVGIGTGSGVDNPFHLETVNSNESQVKIEGVSTQTAFYISNEGTNSTALAHGWYRTGGSWNSTNGVSLMSLQNGNVLFYQIANGAGNGTPAASNMRFTIQGNGNVGMSTTTFGTSATNTLAIANGTAPTTGPSDEIQIYSTDLSAGNTMLGLRTEGTNVGTGTPTADRTVAIEINGTTYYLIASTSAT